MSSKTLPSLILAAVAVFLCAVPLFVHTTEAQRTKAPRKLPSPLPSPTMIWLPLATPVPGTCCGKKPPLKLIPSSSTYASFTGQIAVATNLAANATQPSVVIWDLKNQASAGPWLGSQWPIPQTNFYSNPNWTQAKIGDVFGVTLDKNGNIYVASTKVYGTGNVGSPTVTPGTPGWGDIYKLDGNTGVATRFVRSVNFNTFSPGSNKIPNTGPGLGNISYSCDYDNFYVSNFEDGLIYRIASNGFIFSTRWDHGAALPTATPSRPAIIDTDVTSSNLLAPYTQLGRRVWAVQANGDRLYYSIWSEDGGRGSNSVANEIWSVGLTATGDFSGPAKLEITVPPRSGAIYSNPVADISFGSTGNMLLAERGMASDSFPAPHLSRVLEYAGSWTAQPLNKFLIGEFTSGFTGENAAGGCDYDNGPGGRVWATGDYLNGGQLVYGLQGTPAIGGTNANSILIDLDNVLGSQNKTQVGDVEIPCFQCDSIPPVPVINAPDFTCAKPGQYCVLAPVSGVTYTWNVVGGAPATTTGSCMTITNWYSSIPNKSVSVTATGAVGCSSTSKISLNDCNLYQGECCLLFNAQTNFKNFVHMGNGVYTFTPTLSVNPTNIVRVTADVISSSLTYAPASCGTSGPVNSYITSAPNVPGFTASLPLANGREVIWYNTAGTGVTNLDFPFQIKFPPPPISGGACRDYLTFCVRYTFTDKNCKSCEVIHCYGPIQRGGGGLPN